MSFQKNLLSITIGSLLGLSFSPAISYAAEETQLKKITVTGSHIKRVDVEGALPLVTLDGEKIQLSGASTLSELLRDLTLNNGASFDDKFILSFAPGSSGVSLRGLGQDGTLILLNGRRVASHGFALEGTDTFVDLNSLPLGAVERIEILKDGASAIYGSDALAGVINIITKKNYSGAEVTLNGGTTSHLDAHEGSVNVLAGLAKDHMNLTLGGDYFKRSGFYLGDRDFSASADHSAKEGGVDHSSPVSPTGTVLNPFATDPNEQFLDFNPYNTNPAATAIPATQRMGVMANFDLDVTSGVSFFTEAMLRQVNTQVELPPTPFGTFVSADHPNNTYGQAVVPFWRVVEAGNRIYDLDTTMQRLVSGFEGTLSNWDFETYGAYNISKTVMTGNNFIDANKIDAAVADGTLNPFGTTANTVEAIDAVKIVTNRTGTYKLYEGSAKASSSVYDLDSGPVYLALGLSARHESLADIPDAALAQGIVVGTGGTQVSGYRRVGAVFSELNIPVLENLELQLAGRHEQYSDFGGTTNPKAALRFQPVEKVLLRGSIGTGFRAPSLAEMNTGMTTNVESLIDTSRCDATSDEADCSGNQYLVNLAGNPNLEPEKALSYNFGMVFDLAKGLEVGIDYWAYSHSDIIGSDTQYMLDNEADFASSIHRADAVGDTPGAIESIDGTYYNFAKRKTDGVDLDASYKLALGSFADFFIEENLTFMRSFNLQRTPDAEFEEKAGTYQFPKIRSSSQIGLKRGDISFNTSVNYIHSYRDFVYDENDAENQHRVGSLVTIDVVARYHFLKKSTIILGVENIMDTAPPYSNEFVQGFDISTHNPRGRFVYLTFKHAI